jgi:SulP family sulfate permease
MVGSVPSGLPTLVPPRLRPREVDGLIPLAFGCLLLAYIEGVSAARTFAVKHGYALDARQELLGLGVANLFAAFGGGYPVAGGVNRFASVADVVDAFLAGSSAVGPAGAHRQAEEPA